VRFDASVLVLVLAVAVASPVGAAQPSASHPPKSAPTRSAPPPPAEPPKKHNSTTERATGIVTQPARDVGVTRTEIPAVLEKASDDPYSLTGMKTCRQLSAEIFDLNAALGPDFTADTAYKENKATKLAEAGGKTVINSFIPFRGLVREVSGAASADRRLRAAEQAGFARRGFLRGVYTQRSCRPRM
jgi:hypothetical protein